MSAIRDYHRVPGRRGRGSLSGAVSQLIQSMPGLHSVQPFNVPVTAAGFKSFSDWHASDIILFLVLNIIERRCGRPRGG